MTTDEFNSFKLIQGPKRILSFGSRTISNDPVTYTIIREGVTDANRLQLATNIANFIKKHDLDGVNIDLEYPSVSSTLSRNKQSHLFPTNMIYSGSWPSGYPS